MNLNKEVLALDFTMDGLYTEAPFFIDPELIFTESVFPDDMVQIINEAGPVTKGNFFKKIWGVLKKLWAIIATKCRQITSYITSIFHTKQVDDTTLDDIAEAVLGEIPEVEGSKHMRFTYDNDRRIKCNIAVNQLKKLVKDPKIVGHDKGDRPYQQAFALAFHIIKKPFLLDPLIEFLNLLKNTDSLELSKYPIDRVQKAIDSVWAGATLGVTYTYSMEEWTILNERIQNFQRALQLVDDNTFMEQEQYSSIYAKVMNQLVQLGGYLQKGINEIGDGMRQVYELDQKYWDAIDATNFRKFLPDFVGRCIRSNIPSKYLNRAVRQICDKSINCNPAQPDQKAAIDKPMKGNGRFVIIPGSPDLQKYVIKIAYNNLGIRGNRNEFVVWDKVKNIPEIADELYHIEDIGDRDNCVILCDRANEIDHYEDCEAWNQRMKQMCIDNNIGFIIRCNDGGFGTREDGKVICIDYGNVHRIVEGVEINDMNEEQLFNEADFWDVDPAILFDESEVIDFNEEIITEAKDVKKGNVLQRIWGMIKKFCKWIRDRVHKIVEWVKSKFQKKKAKANPTEIALSVLGIGAMGAAGYAAGKIIGDNVATGDSPESNSTPTSGGAPIDLDRDFVQQNPNMEITNKSVPGGGTQESIKVSIPKDESSSMPVEDFVELAINDLQVKFDEKAQTLEIADWGNHGTNVASAPGTDNYLDRGKPGYVIGLCRHPDQVQVLINIVRMAVDPNAKAGDLKNIFEPWEREFNSYAREYGTIKLQEFMDFEQKFNEIMTIIDPVNETSEQPFMNNSMYIAVVNQLLSRLTDLQFSINNLTNCMAASFKIDGRLVGQIHSEDKLDQFASQCIANGVPPKYVAYNCYLISGRELVGDGTKANAKSPCWGQTRLVMFPDDESKIIKCAVNITGQRTNVAEMKIVRKFKEVGGEQYLPSFIGSGPDSAVCIWERVGSAKAKRATRDQKLKLWNSITDTVNKTKLPMNILTDFHDGNLGWRGNQLVYIDFGGFAKRRNSNVDMDRMNRSEAPLWW